MVQIHAATKAEALWLWPRLQERIRKALSRAAGDSWTEQDLFRHLTLGPGTMMVATDDDDVLGCLIIDIQQRAKGKCLFVLAAAGVDHRRWSSEMNEVIADMARDAGCYCMEAYCADG